MIGIERHFPGEPYYERFVRVGSYTETRCISCKVVFAYRTKQRKLTTCSLECSEDARRHLSGEKRKAQEIEAIEQHGSV